VANLNCDRVVVLRLLEDIDGYRFCSYDIHTEMAGEGGFEPPMTGPKPVALPLGHSPLKLINFISETVKIQTYERLKRHSSASLITP
jgi:hypothetical protein